MIFPAGGLWVAWPKRASGRATTVDENVVREVALPLGLVDNKVCAIDETWSGLRVVWRRATAARLEEGETRQRPDPHVDLADDRRLGDGPPEAAVARLGPVVAHDEDVAGRDAIGVVQREGIGRRPRVGVVPGGRRAGTTRGGGARRCRRSLPTTRWSRPGGRSRASRGPPPAGPRSPRWAASRRPRCCRGRRRGGGSSACPPGCGPRSGASAPWSPRGWSTWRRRRSATGRRRGSPRRRPPTAPRASGRKTARPGQGPRRPPPEPGRRPPAGPRPCPKKYDAGASAKWSGRGRVAAPGQYGNVVSAVIFDFYGTLAHFADTGFSNYDDDPRGPRLHARNGPSSTTTSPATTGSSTRAFGERGGVRGLGTGPPP